VTRARLELLQWFGLFAGPLAFAIDHVVAYASVAADCNPAGSDWTVPQHPIQLTATALAAVVIVAAEGAAFLAYRETQDVSQEGEPPLGRIRFLSTAALIIGPIFLTLVLLGGLGGAAHVNCRQS
jgi:hypothetical protein